MTAYQDHISGHCVHSIMVILNTKDLQGINLSLFPNKQTLYDNLFAAILHRLVSRGNMQLDCFLGLRRNPISAPAGR